MTRLQAILALLVLIIYTIGTGVVVHQHDVHVQQAREQQLLGRITQLEAELAEIRR